MIMMASYTANLAAFLTSEKLEASIDSVDKLASQTKIKYGIQGGGSTAAFFEVIYNLCYIKLDFCKILM